MVVARSRVTEVPQQRGMQIGPKQIGPKDRDGMQITELAPLPVSKCMDPIEDAVAFVDILLASPGGEIARPRGISAC